MIAYAVPERVVDVLEAIQVHHEDGEPELAVPGLGDRAREFVGEARAIGEIGERIFVGQFENAFFAIRDAAAHVIETGSEHADLVAASDVDRRAVVALSMRAAALARVSRGRVMLRATATLPMMDSTRLKAASTMSVLRSRSNAASASSSERCNTATMRPPLPSSRSLSGITSAWWSTPAMFMTGRDAVFELAGMWCSNPAARAHRASRRACAGPAAPSECERYFEFQ